jgi:hypothetical protein
MEFRKDRKSHPISNKKFILITASFPANIVLKPPLVDSSYKITI